MYIFLVAELGIGRLIKRIKTTTKVTVIIEECPHKVISKFGYLFNIHVKLTPKTKEMILWLLLLFSIYKSKNKGTKKKKGRKERQFRFVTSVLLGV